MPTRFQSTEGSRDLSPGTPAGRARSVSRHGSRASSRLRFSRNSSRASAVYVPAPENLILPDGVIGDNTAELLHELVHPHHRDAEPPLFGDHGIDERSEGGDSDAESVDLRKKLPWYKRASPLWFLVFVPLAAAGGGATMAPRVEIFTRLACEVHKPEYTIGRGNDTRSSLFGSSTVFSSDEEMRLCSSDPVVLAEVAKLNMGLALSLGVLSALTTAWWGSLSDRYGRTRILGVCIFGLLMTDVNFLVVSKYYRVLPGGYWFILVGPILDGILGGLTACSAAINAYIADCTEAGARSRMFSLFLGLIFIGIALGPTLGSILIRLTGTPLSVFYVATAQHLFYAAFVVLIVPESLSVRRMLEARRVYNEELEVERQTAKSHGLLLPFKMVFNNLVSPLLIFFPKTPSSNVNPLKRPKRDWNLVLLAASFGGVISIMGSYNYKFQYSSKTFGWTSEQIGYWLSVVGITRAIYLTAILPLVIKLLKPKPKPAIQLPVDPDEPLQPDTSPESPSAEHVVTRKPPSLDSNTHSLVFDLWLARCSLVIELTAYTLIPFIPSALAYTALTMFAAFGSGFSPALHSVILSLYTQGGGTESGKLLGALSVVQALCSQIIGPTLFGLTFLNTVATFPSAIFFLASSFLAFALVASAFVRLPKPTSSDDDPEDLATAPGATTNSEQEDSIHDADVPIIIVEDVNNKPSSPIV